MSSEITTFVTALRATNLFLETTIDPALGVRVECGQHLEGYGDGPIVAIMHGRNGWEIHICPTLGQDTGRIRITVQDVVEGRQNPVEIVILIQSQGWFAKRRKFTAK